jgi:hypothetical protein
MPGPSNEVCIPVSAGQPDKGGHEDSGRRSRRRRRRRERRERGGDVDVTW